MSSHTAFAFACLLLATCFGSTAGVLLRWMEAADGWTVLFWRSLFFVATMALWLLLRYRRRVVRIVTDFGAPELWVSLLFAGATVAFVFALLETSVARVVLVNGLTPFVTALLGWALLGERIGGATWMAMAVALCGIAVMMGSGIAGGSLQVLQPGLHPRIGFRGPRPVGVPFRGHRVALVGRLCAGVGRASVAAPAKVTLNTPSRSEAAPTGR